MLAGPNIHTDDALARANGLPGRVADGMVSTNWISTLLTDAFGGRYLEGGSLRTRYVRPIFEDERIEVVVRITDRRTGRTGASTWWLRWRASRRTVRWPPPVRRRWPWLEEARGDDRSVT